MNYEDAVTIVQNALQSGEKSHAEVMALFTEQRERLFVRRMVKEGAIVTSIHRNPNGLPQQFYALGGDE